MSEKFHIRSSGEEQGASSQGPRVFEGNLQPAAFLIAIVVARFNSQISNSLLEGALGALRALGLPAQNVDVLWVPGAFEIPLTCDRLLAARNIAGVITLGAVIKGETPHFDFVAGECAKGVSSVSLKHQRPVIFGVLTTNTVEQAMNRAGLKSGNKGAEAAHALWEMLTLFHAAQI